MDTFTSRFRDSRTRAIAVVLWTATSCGAGTATTQPDAASQPDASLQLDAAPQPCYNPDPSPPSNGVNIGAIRYDAWFAEPETPPVINDLYLYAHQWFERVPFFASLSAGEWIIASDKQSVVDHEIDYAVTRGIDYWAFVYPRFVTRDYETGTYPDISELDGPHQRDSYRSAYSLDLYLSSAHCNKPRFALILQTDMFNAYLNVSRPGQVSRERAWEIILNDLTEYLKRPEQLETPDGRPILFMFVGSMWGSIWDGDDVLAKQKLEELRQSAVDAGAARPFIVTMDPPEEAAFAINTWGFDAASAYGWNAGLNSGPTGVEVPFSQANFDVDWVATTDVASGLDVIPPLAAGWDYRPQIPFYPSYDRNGNWYEHASPEQFVYQLDHAIEFVKANPTQTTAKSVIIYAWNELGEGGYIMPTLAAGSAKLDAIAQYLGKTIPATTPVLPPVLIPSVTRSATRCTDGYGIWLLGSGFDADSYLQLRSSQVGQEDVIASYPDPARGEAEGQQTLSICLTGTPERSAFAAQGVRVSVVNPNRPSTNTPIVVRLGD